MRSLTETLTRWETTQSHAVSIAEVQRSVRNSDASSPCLSGCRSVCWKIFLLSQDGERSSWENPLFEGRDIYEEKRTHFLKYIKHPEALAKLNLDPLADDPTSPWHTVREDELTRAEILQDVQRLPDDANYHEDHIQSMILDILFVYCKVYPDRGGYRQGMHELLAPIIHVVEQDALSPSLISDGEPIDDLMVQTLDSNFIEHDAYVLFSQLMEHAQSFYETSAIVERSKFIHEVCLQKIDPELAAHLTSIEILPQIFLIRWVRLLFSREFPFSQFLVLWDTMFSVDPSIDLVDLICCAMLLRVRWQLLESDYSVCLQLLLKYPPPGKPHGPQTFVDDALYLRDHLNAAGGAFLISKYTGKAPRILKSPELSDNSSLITGGVRSFGRRSMGMRSPLRSPTRFMQPQGVENLFQGVLERGEKLGINQAVRDAMGEIRRNMQGLNEPRHQRTYERASLDDESAIKALSAMEARNKQLAAFLTETVTSLKAVSVSSLEDKAKSLELIEVAAAKIQFVQIYLEDSSMELPSLTTSLSTATTDDVPQPRTDAKESESNSIETITAPKENGPPATIVTEVSIASISLTDPNKSPVKRVRSNSSSKTTTTSTTSTTATTTTTTATAAAVKKPDAPSKDPTPSDTTPPPPPKTESQKPPSPKPQPIAPIPARSTIAQSSFSWMLEPDESGPVSTPPQAKSPPSNQRRRLAAQNASREKNAFLFGEGAPGEVESRDPLASGDIFGMELIPKPKPKPGDEKPCS